MATNQELINKTIRKMQEKHPEQDPALHGEMLTKIFVEGISPSKAMGISDQFLEFVYGHAGNTFNAGKYDEAAKMYKLLRIYNPQDPRFPMALAACYHRQKKYQEALEMYMVVHMLDSESFAPFYHMSDCFIQLNQQAAAAVVLFKALAMTEGRTDLGPIRERIKMTLDALKPYYAKEEAAK